MAPPIAPSHTCHAIGCRVPVSPRLFCCPKHWRMLPGRYRRGVLREYRAGQEIDKRPSNEYLVVAAQARHWLHLREGVEPIACMVCLGLREA